MSRLRLAVIGAGKVGCSLAQYLSQSPLIELAGFASAHEEHAREAAERIGGAAFANPADAVAAADLVLLTVPDTVIGSVAEELSHACEEVDCDLASTVVAHCSGALPSGELRPLAALGARICSVHPLYAVSSRFACWQELSRCYFTLEGEPRAIEVICPVLDGLGNSVVCIDAAEKTRYHAAAVMASNLVAGLYQEAADQLVCCGFTAEDAERALAPLFMGNAEHIAHDGVARALTGPAARGDQATIERHLSCLSGDDREIYRLLTDVLYRVTAQR